MDPGAEARIRAAGRSGDGRPAESYRKREEKGRETQNNEEDRTHRDIPGEKRRRTGERLEMVGGVEEVDRLLAGSSWCPQQRRPTAA